jgi:FKBP-type peptidyl-prolyl cis-trans isomerase SlyD
MTISKNKVVSIHYTLTSSNGDVIESSREREPMHYLHGGGNIIRGLESALEGKDVGDVFQVTIEPADAYGEKRAANLQRVSAKHFSNPRRLRPGQVVGLQTRQGPVQVTVVKVGRFNVDVDANHPLAGETLTFDVEVTGIRDATDEEKAHGHVHGPGGAMH